MNSATHTILNALIAASLLDAIQMDFMTANGRMPTHRELFVTATKNVAKTSA